MRGLPLETAELRAVLEPDGPVRMLSSSPLAPREDAVVQFIQFVARHDRDGVAEGSTT